MVSGLTTQKRWWQQQAVGWESQEHMEASELWWDVAECQGQQRDGSMLLWQFISSLRCYRG